jgi:serine/threonine protein kinase
LLGRTNRAKPLFHRALASMPARYWAEKRSVVPSRQKPAVQTFDSRPDTVLYSNERTRIVRRCLPVEGIIIKQALGGEAVARLRHEMTILERLAGVEGIPQVVPAECAADQLAMRDEHGTPLPERLKAGRLKIEQAIDLILQLARIVAAMHRRGVVHKDINPANVLMIGPEERPVLIDFSIASVFAED